MQYPLFIIAGVMRSGTTLLLELLTDLPYSFIFNETGLCDNKFNVSKRDAKPLIKLYNINVHKLIKAPFLNSFKTNVIPVLDDRIMQIGLKELWCHNWKRYVKKFPDCHFIITGRDPRDLYLSVYYWRKRSNPGMTRLSSRRLNLLKKQMNAQMEIYKNHEYVFKSKYEKLCLNSDRQVEKIKKFINSPIPNTGKVGKFIKTRAKRKREIKQHNGKITSSSIGKWKTESNLNLVKEANKFFNSLPEYCKFWGYK